MLQCNFCSATFRKLQHNFRFRLWHVAGVGFRGVGFRTCWNEIFKLRAWGSVFSHAFEREWTFFDLWVSGQLLGRLGMLSSSGSKGALQSEVLGEVSFGEVYLVFAKFSGLFCCDIRSKTKTHPAAKGVQQKESGKKVTKKVTKASEKVTEKWPNASRKQKKVIELLLRHPEKQNQPQILMSLHSKIGGKNFMTRFCRVSSPILIRKVLARPAQLQQNRIQSWEPPSSLSIRWRRRITLDGLVKRSRVSCAPKTSHLKWSFGVWWQPMWNSLK